MNGKTPQFDEAIARYFAGLALDENAGQWRTCRFSGERFYVRPEDIGFYKSIRVPLPTLSPLERSRRRMAFAPSYNFYRVKSAATGDSIISIYPSGTPFKIYEHQRWFSDKWDPMEFGQTYGEGEPFFEQFRALQRAVPRSNLFADGSNINSDYTNSTHHLKNSYMTFGSAYGENNYYSEGCLECNDCVDCWMLEKSQSCYKCWGGQLQRCVFCHYSFQCFESTFLYDCTNCEYCFMSSNLRNKKYYFRNVPLTKEEYKNRMQEINLGNHEVFEQYRNEFETLKKNAIRKSTFNERAINSVGDWITNSRDCFNVLFTVGCERVAYSQGLLQYRDSYDCLFGCNGELCYEFMAMDMAENNNGDRFSSLCNNSRNLEYSDLCYNSHDCFGCVGLRNKSYCIFNRQYAEDEYWPTVDQIKTAMLEAGEYGEFFPPELSSFPYKASLITNYKGYDDFENAKRYGYRMEEIPQDAPVGAGDADVVRSGELLSDIKNVDDSVLQKVIIDEENNKKFRITKYELEFYRKQNLPLPRVHPFIRMNEWRKDFDLRLRFFERPCAKCGKMMQTIYAPDRPEKNVYCEQCYNAEVS